MKFGDFEWERTEKDAWEVAYESGSGDLLYLEDKYENKQTELPDWDDERYAVMFRTGILPLGEDRTIYETDNYQEAEALIESIAGDFDADIDI